MIVHSIKLRLQAWHGFLLTVLVAGLMTGFYVFERGARIQSVDNDLAEAIAPLRPRFTPPVGRGFDERGPGGLGERGRRLPPPRDGDGPPLFEDGPPEGGPPAERIREMRVFETGNIYFTAWAEDGARIAASTNAPGDLVRPKPREAKPGRILQTRGLNREMIEFVPSGRCLLVGTSLAPTLDQLHKLAVTLALLGVAIVAVGFAVGWWLATRALRPIAEISTAAQEIAAGDLAKRINASETESELGQLATVLNSTFARLEAAFAQQKQFTADAAHELRTPVSVILTQIQSTLNKDRTGSEYRETLEACQRAAQRMRRLIESLLELARLDAGQDVLKRMPFDLAKTVGDCVELVRPLAEQRKIKLTTELAAAPTLGDTERVAQVVTNLLGNAVQHTPEGSAVRITTQLDGGATLLTVADNGPGIAAEHLPHIFDRFYRGDAARTTALGSTGLGLAISKAIVEAQGGSIEVESAPGRGATFRVRLPAA